MSHLNLPVLSDSLLQESDYLYIKKSKLNKSGKGLFTAIDIYKGEIISYYRGEVISNKKGQKRAEKGQDRYFINLLNGKILDSMHVPCFAKYANDAKGPGFHRYKNNTQISLNDDYRVCLVAKKDIKAGKEILCAYGKAYWKKHG